MLRNEWRIHTRTNVNTVGTERKHCKKKKKKVKVVFLSSARTNSASAGSVLINPPVSERKTPPQKD